MMRMILNDLRVHPGRSVLTALSLFLGVLAVVAIVVGGSVVRDYLVAIAEQRDGRAPTYSGVIEGTSGVRTADALSLIGTLPAESNRGVAVIAAGAGSVTIARAPAPGEALTFVQVDTLLVAGDLTAVKRLPITSGRWLSSDGQVSPFEVVLNEEAQRVLGDVGQTVALSGPSNATASAATIVGVVNDGLTDQPTAYVKLTPLASFAPQTVSVTSLLVLWHSPSDAPESITSALSDLANDAGLKPPVEVKRVDTVNDFVGPIAGMQVASFGAAALALLVAALGIVNIGLASIRERSRELVIRRAVGAKRSDIFGLIVGSSLVLSSLVAALAILVSFAAVAMIPGWLPAGSPIDPPAYPWLAAVVGTGAALTTAVVGSFVPGLRASRIEPATALRE